MDQIRNGLGEKRATAFKAPARRSWLTWLVLATLLSIGIAIWWYRSGPDQPPADAIRTGQPVSVGVAAIETGNINVTLDALGTVTSLATVTVKSQISGQLVQLHFEEGQEVKKGDLLAEIDSRPYEAVLAQAQGQLARDQALLKGAEVDLKRYQDLVAHNAIQHQTLDTQVALVAQYQGTIEVDKATIQSATVNLDFCRILAPVDGRAGLRQVDQGNYVTAGDPAGIVVITQIQPISVLFTVPEDQIQAISARLHQGATLSVGAYDRSGNNKIADGKLATFDSQIDPTTGTIKLRASFDNGDRTLFPNQFVNIRLLIDEHVDAVIAPTTGVLRGVPGTFVYLVNADDTVSVRKVTPGITDGERMEILSGVSPGDRIVVDGTDKLRDGAKISLRPETQSGQPPQEKPAPAPAPAADVASPPQPGSGRPR